MAMLWFNPSQQLSTVHVLTHSSPALVGWEGESQKGKTCELR